MPIPVLLAFRGTDVSEHPCLGKQACVYLLTAYRPDYQDVRLQITARGTGLAIICGYLLVSSWTKDYRVN